MRKIFCFIVFVLLHSVIQAKIFQENGPVLKGKVTDIKGMPLAGASITVENTILGVNSDQNGNFSLQVFREGNYIIHFSFIGYESEIRNVSLNADTVLNVILNSKSFMTEEVLVTSTRAGENTPMAYATGTKDEISKADIAQDVPYLLGYTPSLVVSSDAGTGVGYTYINIRGSDVKRINVTIDGVPVNDAESHGVWWVDLPDLASSA